MSERFIRTQLLLGDTAMDILAAARVTVVGLGAVGGHVVEALARSGIGHLRLVDSDVVRESNLNRQLLALESSIGLHKADLAAARVREINPACEVEALRSFANTDSFASILDPQPDALVDAIDSLNPKVGLIEAGVRRGLPVFSSMGAARHLDPGSIRVADLAQTKQCPLARYVRLRLARRGIREGVTCVYSDEPAPRALDPVAQGPEHPAPDGPPGRPRQPMGSLATITGIFGLTLAHAVIRHLLEGEGQWKGRN